MWTIHPLFLEMGEKFSKNDSTLWALAFMNMISYRDGEWYTMESSDLRNDMVLDQAMSSLAHGYLQEWMPTIKKTFSTFSNTIWGGSINTIKETAENYDKHGIDGVNLVIKPKEVLFDNTNDFSYPIEGFVFIDINHESINRKNILEVLQ